MRVGAPSWIALGLVLALPLGCTGSSEGGGSGTDGGSSGAPAGSGGTQTPGGGSGAGGVSGAAVTGGASGSAGANAGSSQGGSSGDASGGSSQGGSSGDASGGSQSGSSSGGVGPLDCDLRKVTCRRAEPVCPEMQVPRVDGSCYGECVPIMECGCMAAEECPHEESYTCHRSAMRCGPYVG